MRESWTVFSTREEKEKGKEEREREKKRQEETKAFAYCHQVEFGRQFKAQEMFSGRDSPVFSTDYLKANTEIRSHVSEQGETILWRFTKIRKICTK